MKHRFLFVAGVTALCSAFAGEAAAQNNGDYPVRLVSRPQTIPARTVRVDASFYATRLSTCATTGLGRICLSGTSTNLDLGGAFGITHDLEVGAVVAPLQLTESFQYGNPSVYGRYQFLHGNGLQVAAQLSASIPVRDGSKLGIGVGVPVWYNFSDAFQLQSGLFYQLSLTDPITHALSVPLLFNFNVTDEVHVALRTGINLPLQDTGDTMSVPLGIEGGYVIRGANNRPMLDLVANFTFPSFLVPGSSGDKVFTDLWTAGLTGRFYLFL